MQTIDHAVLAAGPATVAATECDGAICCAAPGTVTEAKSPEFSLLAVL